MKGKAKKVLTLVLALLLTVMTAVFYAACGETDEPGPGPDPGLPDDATVVELTISDPPDVTEYYIGETFDPTGMKVKAKWSDGVKLRVNIADCTIDPSGPLEAGDRQVTITYGGVSVVQEITLKDDTVSSITVDTGNIPLKAAVGTPMNFSNIVVTAHYADGAERLVNGGYTFKVDGEAVTDVSALTFDESGEHTLTVVYGAVSADITIDIFEGFVIEAENVVKTSEVTSDMRNFVELCAPGKSSATSSSTTYPYKQQNADEPASGGAYLGSVFKEAVMRFHIWADEPGYADVILRASSCYMTEDGGSWSPIEVGDQQFNRLFEISYGSAADAEADTLERLYVSDDVVLKGGRTDIATGDGMLFVNWMDVNFGTLPLEAGDNILEFNVITDYVNSRNQQVACNIDRLEVQYYNGTPPAAVTATELTVKTPPTKTEYLAGDVFDPAGMVVEAKLSDGTTETAKPNDLTITPSGALGTEDTSVTISYRGATAVQPIKVLAVKSLAIETPPTKTTYKSGESFDPAGMIVKATMSDDSVRTVDNADLTITPSGTLTMSDAKVTVTYRGATAEQTITVEPADVITIEGENLIASPTADDKNYVEAVRNGYQGKPGEKYTEAPGVAETSGDHYLNGLFGIKNDKPGAIVRFHIWSDEATTATVKIYVSSCNVTKRGSDGTSNWNPCEMGDVQFNQVFAVRFGTADDLDPVTINDDVIVKGGKTDDGKTSMALWENWREITLGTFDLAVGDNILELENINSTLKNLAGEIYGMNVDKLVVEFA